MPKTYRAALIGCGRMGATIDDEIRGHPTRTPTLPWAHAAGFAACERTELVAVSDVDADKAEAIRARYGARTAYADYREMIRVEQPDIVGIATRPGTHAEMAIHAAESDVRGIYCEKPLCCSMEQADAIVEAVERNRTKFNYGTNRRFYPLFRSMRAIIDSGELGDIQAVIAYCGTGSAQWWHTHTADAFLNLAGDADVDYVQASVIARESDWDGNRLNADPGIEMGFVRFRNGVRGYLTSATGYEFEVSGTKGKLRTQNDYAACQWRKYGAWELLEERPFPAPEPESATVNLIRDLAEAIDTNADTLGNVHLARKSQEIIFGFIESGRLGGKRVPFPLANRALHVEKADW
ncbi:Gfo/Idh/MocA family oxidoreductase [Candidatus Poribacteria bacterium]|nr:Gfo/Idh/MocA family oxidoreductase [Candidatus Poribacteria bacterium]